jgi:gliding motility-associated-like protein
MKPIINILVGLLLLLAAPAVLAQPILDIAFSPAQPSGTVGSVITVDVRANVFEGIAGMQFPILYDKNKLQFKTCKNLITDLPGFIYAQATGNPPLCPGGGTPPCATNIDNPTPGKISLAWNDPAGAPNFLDPNTILFQIEFTVLQPGTSEIYIASAPPPNISVFGQGNVQATFTYPTGNPVINGFALIIPNDTVAPGDRVCMPIRVNDFNSVIGMQFMLNWNSNFFTFSHIQNYNLPGLNGNSFNSGVAGQCSVVWDDATNVGVTLPNGTSIFELCLAASGPSATNGAASNVAANGVGMPAASPIAIENTQGANLWAGANSSIPGTMRIISNTPQELEIVRFCVDTILVPSVGDSAAVTIRVDKFKNLNQFQFVLSYNTDILGTGLPSVSSLAVPNASLSVNNCGGKQLKVELVPNNPGKLRVSWRVASASTFQTLADGSVLMVLKFPTSSATPGAFTPVSIGGLASPAIGYLAQEKPNTFPPASCLPTFGYLPLGKSGSVRLGANSGPQITLVSKTDVNCFGNNIGAIDINVTGGTTTAYNYAWAGPNSFTANTQDIANRPPGTYTVTVTAGTASTTFSTTIAGPTAPIGISGVQVQNVKCFGTNDGAITINVNGGTTPYTFDWGGGITTQNRTNLSAGTYSVTITDAKGCTFVPSPAYSITAPQQAMAVSTANLKNVRCLNEANGSVTINTNNGQGALSYAWQRNGAAFTATPAGAPTNLSAATYAVTVTDAQQCTSTVANIVVAAPPSQLDATITTTNPVCAGQNSGTITVSPFGGWPGVYTPTWSAPQPGLGGLSPTGVGTGTYNVTITDANNCPIVRSAVVVAGNDIAITNTTVTNVTCFNQGNGSISIALNGAFTSVNWTMNGNPAGSGVTISNLGPGTYIPTVSYGGGCTKIFPSLQVNSPAPLVVTGEPDSVDTNINNGAIDLTVTGGNPGAYGYSWTGPNGFTFSSQDPSNLAAGVYTVTVTDSQGCVSTASFTLYLKCAICAAKVTATKACATDGCLNLDLPTSSVGPYLVKWTSSVNPVEKTITVAAGDFTPEICGLPAGVYNITVVDATNQAHLLSTSIGQRPPVALTETVQNANNCNNNGAITLTSAPGTPLFFEWISGTIPVPPNVLTSPVLFQLDSGIYRVRITNLLPEGCVEERSYNIVCLFPTLAPCDTAALVNPNCLSTNTGTVEVFPQGGDNTYTYAWSNSATTQKISGLGGGTYTVTVTSGDGQTGVCGPYTIAPLSNLAITNVNELSSYNGFQVSGVGVCNGSASAVVSGATGTVTYLWSNGVTTAQNTTLCGGAYTVVATDLLGCNATFTGELTSPQALSATHNLNSNFNGFGVSCFGSCNGAARINVNGGVAPYFVKWPTGQTEVINTPGGLSFETDLCAGEVIVEITDANNVVTNHTINITEPEQMTVTFADAAPISYAQCSGEIIPTVTGAIGAITYEWFSQFHEGTTQRADDLCAEEEVTYIITDANGCTITADHIVPLPPDVCFLATPVVTPNGDGYNDYFEIKCIDARPNTVTIFDRWNQAVTNEFTNYANNFDGKRNGVALPEGVYFFVANFTDDQGNQRTLKGHFNILH